MAPQLARRLQKLESRVCRAQERRPLSGADSERAKAALAAEYGLTTDAAITAHGSWPAFVYWALCHPARASLAPDDGLSWAERYQAMLG